MSINPNNSMSLMNESGSQSGQVPSQLTANYNNNNDTYTDNEIMLDSNNNKPGYGGKTEMQGFEFENEMKIPLMKSEQFQVSGSKMKKAKE